MASHPALGLVRLSCAGAQGDALGCMHAATAGPRHARARARPWPQTRVGMLPLPPLARARSTPHRDQPACQQALPRPITHPAPHTSRRLQYLPQGRPLVRAARPARSSAAPCGAHAITMRFRLPQVHVRHSLRDSRLYTVRRWRAGSRNDAPASPCWPCTSLPAHHGGGGHPGSQATQATHGSLDKYSCMVVRRGQQP